MSIIGKFGPFEPGDSDCRVWGTVVHFGTQGGQIFVWAECQRDRNPNSYDSYCIVATGEDLQGQRHYGTVIDTNGYVWHLVR